MPGQKNGTAAIESLWNDLLQADAKHGSAEKEFWQVREELVRRLCTCYREDMPWEDAAMQCAKRLEGRCPFYLELQKRAP
jgi:hypothetical protein